MQLLGQIVPPPPTPANEAACAERNPEACCWNGIDADNDGLWDCGYDDDGDGSLDNGDPDCNWECICSKRRQHGESVECIDYSECAANGEICNVDTCKIGRAHV